MAYRASGKGDSPCYGCTERHMGCHSNCLRGLRMENEYLKKLNALVQEREKSKKPTK